MAEFNLRLDLKAFGDLGVMMDEEIDEIGRAASIATSTTLDVLKGVLRQQVLAAFGSQRLANTWRTKSYPNKGYDAAGVAWSNAPHIIEAFSSSTTIKSANGFWLAIPSPECPRGSGGRRLTPSNFPEGRFGKLQFVYRPGKASLLVVHKVRRRTGKRKGITKASATAIKRGQDETIVMFFLVPMVQLRKLIDPEAAFDQAAEDLVRNVINELNNGRRP